MATIGLALCVLSGEIPYSHCGCAKSIRRSQLTAGQSPLGDRHIPYTERRVSVIYRRIPVATADLEIIKVVVSFERWRQDITNTFIERLVVSSSRLGQ